MKYLYISLEIVALLIQVFMMYFFSPFFHSKTLPSLLSIDTISIYLVFGFAPILLLSFTLLTVFFQWKQRFPLDLLFGLVVAASLVLIHSWGMHSFMVHSVIASIVSIALTIFGLIKIRSL